MRSNIFQADSVLIYHNIGGNSVKSYILADWECRRKYMPAKWDHFKLRVIITRGKFFVSNLKTTCYFSFEVRHPRCVELKLQNGKSTVKIQLYLLAMGGWIT